MNARLYPDKALHARIAHEVGRRIASGQIGEGQLLPREMELQEEFSAGRQAVREALKVLAAKGMIVARKRAGTSVRARSAWNMLDPDVLAWHPPHSLPASILRDLVEMRRLIEPSAAALAAQRATAQDVDRIGAALSQMNLNVDHPQEFYRADIDFHLAIFAASGNSLIDRLSTILKPLLEASFRLQSEANTSFDKGFEFHAAVFEAISSRDGNMARTAMERLLDRAITEVLSRQSD